MLLFGGSALCAGSGSELHIVPHCIACHPSCHPLSPLLVFIHLVQRSFVHQQRATQGGKPSTLLVVEISDMAQEIARNRQVGLPMQQCQTVFARKFSIGAQFFSDFAGQKFCALSSHHDSLDGI